MLLIVVEVLVEVEVDELLFLSPGDSLFEKSSEPVFGLGAGLCDELVVVVGDE